MIEHLISEINSCLKNDLQIAALTMALTLPDTCGKVYCPTGKNREHYVCWYNDHIIAPKKNLFGFDNADCFYASGEVVYKLRCAMLHESNPVVGGTAEKIKQFSLIWRSASSASRTPIESYTQVDEEDKIISKTLSIDIVSLCQDICDAALKYYLENKDKFSFDYRIVSTTDSVAKVFGFDNTMKV